MNNTDKLLRAFIEASGFEIEEGKVTAGDLIDRSYSSASYSTKEMKQRYPNKHLDTECFGGKWIVSEPVIEYKVTKKPELLYDGISLRQLTQNVIDIECDPTLAIEDKWIKYPKDSFYAVIDWFGNDAIRCNEHRYNIFNVEVSLNENT